MKKKKLTAIIGIVLLLAAICVIVVVYHNSDTTQKSYSSIEEANKAADFNLEHSDRLCGYPASEFEANSSTIEVKFDEAGIIRKTLGVTDNSGSNSSLKESSEENVNGRKVTFKGKNDKIYLATWNYNNFAYTISLNQEGEGVSKEEMIKYIEATN